MHTQHTTHIHTRTTHSHTKHTQHTHTCTHIFSLLFLQCSLPLPSPPSPPSHIHSFIQTKALNCIYNFKVFADSTGPLGDHPPPGPPCRTIPLKARNRFLPPNIVLGLHSEMLRCSCLLWGNQFQGSDLCAPPYLQSAGSQARGRPPRHGAYFPGPGSSAESEEEELVCEVPRPTVGSEVTCSDVLSHRIVALCLQPCPVNAGKALMPCLLLLV